MKTLNIALIGSGYGGILHAKSYSKVSNIPVKIKTVVDAYDIEKAKRFSETFSIAHYTDDLNDILNDPEIDIIDIVTPPDSHIDIAIKALKASKNVICEKPLTGYFGEEDDERPIGIKVSKSKMYKKVIEQMDELKRVIESSGKQFMYAENFVYCPSIRKSAEIIKSKKSKILFMRGEESLIGSSSPVAGRWSKTGGGSLIRIGCHPLTGILWLKQVEAKARDENIDVVGITADMGVISPGLSQYDKRHLKSDPYDVEEFANVTITFSDNTKAIVIASDNVLGGSKNYIEIYTNDGALINNITLADNLKTYFLDEYGLENIEFSEMLPAKTGWNNIFVCDEILRGYVYELQDFAESVAYNRKPVSGFELAYDAIKVIYAAYQSASEGRKIIL